MSDSKLRIHGAAPFAVAVIHGGPGAAGEMQPVAEALASVRGVLEPFQTASSVDGQVSELAALLLKNASTASTLIGHSWGAWLALLLAARHPDLVSNLILVSCGVLTDDYVPVMRARRLERLGPDGPEFERAIAALEGCSREIANATTLDRLGELGAKADAYDRLPPPETSVAFGDQSAIYASVWPEAAALRTSGELRDRLAAVACPILAIHGADDPSPWEGVAEPLRAVVPNSRVVILERCGHTPWLERHAREPFYAVLERELLMLPTS